MGFPSYAPDLAGFMMLFGLPVMFPEAANEERTPAFMRWLRRIAERDSVREALDKGTGRFAVRFRELLASGGNADA